jgi:MoxR-like ATPase
MDRVVTIHEKLLSERKHRGKMETTRACQMVIDYLFKNRAPYLLIDEIDKMSPRDQTFLLNLMETGIVNRDEIRKDKGGKNQNICFCYLQ